MRSRSITPLGCIFCQAAGAFAGSAAFSGTA
jgi:hypothetical protein